MADIQSQLPVRLTDGTNTAGITAGSAIKVDGSAVTQPVSGTVTHVPSGTQSVTGTVTLSSQTVTLSSNTVTLSSQTVTTTADTAVTAGSAPTRALLGAAVYNTALPTLTNGQTVALQTDVNGNLKIAGTLTTSPTGTQAVSGTVTNVPSGTQAVSGTVTNVPSGTQTVTGTVTLSSNTVTLSSQTVTTNAESTIGAGTAPTRALVGGFVYNSTQPTLTTGQTAALQGDVNGNLKVVLQGTSTVTSVPSGTQTVTGTVTLSSQTVTVVPSGTQAVSGTVTNVPSGTQAVSGTVTNVPSGTQTVAGTVTTSSLVSTGIVNSYSTSSALANGSTATLSYTVTSAKTLYLKGIFASSSGAPCKVIVDYGAGPTVLAVGFYSTTQPFLSIDFPQPPALAANTVVNVKIQNNAGAAQDVYATIMGQEI